MQDTILFLRLFPVGDWDPVDQAFREIRRAVLEDTVSEKVCQCDTLTGRCRYRFDKKHREWTVKQGRRVLQQLHVERDRSYQIRAEDPENGIVRVESFSADHQWLRVEEFLNGDSTVSAEWDGDGLLLRQRFTEDSTVRERKLIPCPEVAWDSETQMDEIARDFGMPPAVAETLAGTVCFYEASVAQRMAEVGKLPRGARVDSLLQAVSDAVEEMMKKISTESEAELEKVEELSFSEIGEEPTVSVTEAAEEELPDFEEIAEGEELFGEKELPESEEEEIPTEIPAEEPVSEPEEPPIGREENVPVCCRIDRQDGEILLEYQPEGETAYIGGIVNEERSGFGVGADFAAQKAIVGNWLYGGCRGASVTPEANGSLQVVLEDSAMDGADRIGCRITAEGRLQYAGALQGGVPEGFGMGKLSDGNYYAGIWHDQLPDGQGAELEETGVLRYEGQWKRGKRHGFGTEYADGHPRYEGQWEQGRPMGSGTIHTKEGHRLVGKFGGSTAEFLTEYDAENHKTYIGNFVSERRHGVGASFDGGQPQYFGQWERGKRQGCGVEYENGVPSAVGCFTEDRREGRIDEYRNGVLFRETVCHEGRADYLLEYDADGNPVYAGNFRDGRRSGVGRLLGEYGETLAEGVFRDGVLVRSVPVSVREPEELPCPEVLRRSVYESLSAPAVRCVLERPYGGGIYSGRWSNGRPEGKGSWCVGGEVFLGTFRNGIPQGAGMMLTAEGGTVNGSFTADGLAFLTGDRRIPLTSAEEPESV